MIAQEEPRQKTDRSSTSVEISIEMLHECIIMKRCNFKLLAERPSVLNTLCRS